MGTVAAILPDKVLYAKSGTSIKKSLILVKESLKRRFDWYMGRHK